MIKKIFYMALPGLLFSGIPGFAQMNVHGGCALVMDGAPSIVLNNIDLSISGNLMPASSNFIFRGNANNIDLTVNSNFPFYNLTLNKSSNNVTLNSQVTVNNDLTMTNGNLELNNNTVLLNGQIVGETAASYITGTTGGKVQKTLVLNAPAGVNPGNMGFEISSAANMGSTVIYRSHVQQTSATGYGINRYYSVVPSNNAGLNATVVFHYLDNELAGITESELNMWKSPNNGVSWDLLGVDALNTTTNQLTKNGINSFSWLTLGSVLNNPLPVNLLSFTGNLVNRQTQLQWKMATEDGIAYYELQRSADGNDFSIMKQVTANGSLSYTGVDPLPFEGYTYYRLKIFSKTNEFSYSNTVKVYLGNDASVNIYPNPATDKIFIEFTAHEKQSAVIRLTDQSGKLVASKTVSVVSGKNRIEWSLEKYASAVYYLHLDDLNYSAIKITKL